MTGRWFILSRGRKRLQDYSWLSVGGGDDEPLVRTRQRTWSGQRIEDLLDDTQPGLVLAQDADLGLIVYATCVPLGRTVVERAGREIRATVLGVSPASEARAEILSFAASMLDGSLSPLTALTFDTEDEAGFEVDPAGWLELLAASGAAESAAADVEGPPARNPEVRSDEERERERTAQEIRSLIPAGRLEQLPGPVLLLCAPAIDRARHDAVKPWRTLSDARWVSGLRTSSDADGGWSRQEIAALAKDTAAQQATRLGSAIKGLIGGIGGLLVVVAAVWYFGFGHDPSTTPKPSTTTPISDNQTARPSGTTPQPSHAPTPTVPTATASTPSPTPAPTPTTAPTPAPTPTAAQSQAPATTAAAAAKTPDSTTPKTPTQSGTGH